MGNRLLAAPLVLALFSTFAHADQWLIDPVGTPNGATIYTEKGATYTAGQSGVRMQLNGLLSAFGLRMNNVNWSQYTYLVANIKNNSSVTTPVTIVFDSGGIGCWAWSTTLVGPGSTVSINLPLQGIGRRMPASRLNGNTQTKLSGVFEKGSVQTLRIWNPVPSPSQDLTLTGIRLESEAVRTTAIVDGYGQQTISFAGRITSDTELATQAAEEALNLPGTYPYPADMFGGVVSPTGFRGTRLWSTKKVGGRWLIVDPLGSKFFSAGICEVGASPVFIDGQQEMFAPGALPSSTGPLGEFYEQVQGANGSWGTGFNYYLANLQRKYGPLWRNLSLNNAVSRMKSWGFNTVGPSPRWEFQQTTSPMVHTPQVNITGSFRRIPVPEDAWFPMPDPYDPAWVQAVGTSLAPVVTRYNYAYVHMGMFVDNELPWAGFWDNPMSRYKLAFDVLCSPADQPAKIAFIARLQAKYGAIAALNAAWNSSFSSWSSLQSSTTYRPLACTAEQEIDTTEFIGELASKYFGTIRGTLNDLGYRGLYLGCRFDFYTPEVLNAAKQYCHVVSFNCYEDTPSRFKSALKSLDAPVLIGEYAFAASDRGRAGGSTPISMTEEDRISAFQSFVNDAYTWPNLVGMHYYRWADEPVVGRHYDNGNETNGLVSITDAPYQQFVAAAKQANLMFHNRLRD